MPGYLITWPHLTRGTLLRRYKRFMADVEVEGGGVITAHCPNSGRMLSCSEPGRPVFLSHSDNLKRKYPFTLEIIDMPGSLVAVNTLRANQAAVASIRWGLIPEFAGYTVIRPEVRFGDRSRIDLLLDGAGCRPALVEVKSCTYAMDGCAMFPDATTERGLRHLRELQLALEKGYRCVTFYLVQRMDAGTFRPADHIDEAYGRELRRAFRKGMEILVHRAEITREGMALGPRIPFLL